MFCSFIYCVFVFLKILFLYIVVRYIYTIIFYIFIRGNADSTKLAHSFITTMIKDPDVDIVQMLSASGTRPKGPTSTISSILEKTQFIVSVYNYLHFYLNFFQSDFY